MSIRNTLMAATAALGILSGCATMKPAEKDSVISFETDLPGEVDPEELKKVQDETYKTVSELEAKVGVASDNISSSFVDGNGIQQTFNQNGTPLSAEVHSRIGRVNNKNYGGAFVNARVISINDYLGSISGKEVSKKGGSLHLFSAGHEFGMPMPLALGVDLHGAYGVGFKGKNLDQRYLGNKIAETESLAGLLAELRLKAKDENGWKDWEARLHASGFNGFNKVGITLPNGRYFDHWATVSDTELGLSLEKGVGRYFELGGDVTNRSYKADDQRVDYLILAANGKVYPLSRNSPLFAELGIESFFGKDATIPTKVESGTSTKLSVGWKY